MTTPRRTRSPRGAGESLRQEIIDAATDLFAEHDDDTAVSIRAVATRVGVTPPSIYLHFVDKDSLVDAVCAHYFEELDAALAAAAEGVSDPLDKGLEQGMAYVRFAVSTPVLYRLAFRPMADARDSMVDEVLSKAAFARFAGTITELADEGLVEHEDVVATVMELWSAAHGVSSLMIAKPQLPWGDDFALAESVLRSVCLGRVTLGLLGDRPDSSDVRALLTELRAARGDEQGAPTTNLVKKR